MFVKLALAALVSGAVIAPALAGDAVNVDIKLFQFKPRELVVQRGATVTWLNSDAIEHSVTAGEPGAPATTFDSGFFSKGGQFSHTFDQAGSFAYFCRRHPNMHAVVKVE